MRTVIAFVLSAITLLAQTPGLVEQADAAFRDGDLERSSDLARRALSSDPNAVSAHMILGVIAARQQDWQAATRHFGAVIRLEPGNPHGYFYLGQAKLYQQEWPAAIKYFSAALKREYPEKGRILVELAFAQNEIGRPDQALETLAAVSPAAEEAYAAQYHAVMASAHDRLNHGVLAVEAIRRALQADGANPHYWEFLIGTLLKNDQAPQALAEAIRAQQKFPDHPEIQYLFALAGYHVAESPLGGVALRNLKEADPGSARVLLAEGLLHRKHGRNEEATVAFRRAAERGVDDAHLLLGIVHKENGDYAAAEREYREAAKANPRSGQVLLELGKLLLSKGQLEEARTRLEQAAAVMPDASAVQYQLGLVYSRLGQTERAKEHFQRAKQPERGAR